MQGSTAKPTPAPRTGPSWFSTATATGSVFWLEQRSTALRMARSACLCVAVRRGAAEGCSHVGEEALHKCGSGSSSSARPHAALTLLRVWVEPHQPREKAVCEQQPDVQAQPSGGGRRQRARANGQPRRHCLAHLHPGHRAEAGRREVGQQPPVALAPGRHPRQRLRSGAG